MTVSRSEVLAVDGAVPPPTLIHAQRNGGGVDRRPLPVPVQAGYFQQVRLSDGRIVDFAEPGIEFPGQHFAFLVNDHTFERAGTTARISPDAAPRTCHASGMTGGEARYDTIGRSYTKTRREDPRIAAAIHAALGPPGSVVNIGAGSGNYEPVDRDVVAVEPSLRMLQQRHSRRAASVRGVAERLPFPNESFDVAMAVLTVHHWSDPAAGMREMARVSHRQVVFFFEPLQTHTFWALEYFPSALDLPTEQDPPGADLIAEHLRVQEVHPVLVPHDCRDGFGVAFWARPEAYLDPEVQAGMSWLAMLGEDDRHLGTGRLRADLDSGEWDRRYGHLRQEAEYDGGYRIAVAY